jgi:hypothetical protein
MFMHIRQGLRPSGMGLFVAAAILPLVYSFLWLSSLALYLLGMDRGKWILPFADSWLPAALLASFSMMLLITIMYAFRNRRRALRLALATIGLGLVPLPSWGLFIGPGLDSVGKRLVANGKGYFMTASSNFSDPRAWSGCSEDGRWLTSHGCYSNWYGLCEFDTLWIQCSVVAYPIVVSGVPNLNNYNPSSHWPPDKIALRAADGAIQMVLTGFSSDGQPREKVVYSHQLTTTGFSLPLVLVMAGMAALGSYLVKRGWDMEHPKRKRKNDEVVEPHN